MIKLKDYSWALEGLAALLLLVAFVMMSIGNKQVNDMIVLLTGVGLLFFTLIRIKPILASRNEKDFIIIMLLEIIVDLVVALTFIFARNYIVAHDDELISFSHLSGLALFIRGVTHFYTTSKRYELHDMFSFIINILFISFGFLFLFTNNLKSGYIVTALLALSLLLIGFFGYRSYRGYNNFRLKKTNAQKIDNYLNKKEEKPVDDPKHIEEQKNPKVIEEPKDDRPGVNVN